jgi:predicted nucleic acid-binding Zn ribbon protein
MAPRVSSDGVSCRELILMMNKKNKSRKRTLLLLLMLVWMLKLELKQRLWTYFRDVY